MTSASAVPASARGRVRAFLDLVMIEHSVFALPFAYIAALTAMHAADRRVHWLDLLLVTLAMVAARTFAMAANRIIDRYVDAANPRTAGRELVTGVVSLTTARVGAGIALAVFLASAAALNPLALALAPLAVVPLVLYSYAKRFTNLTQAFLALAQWVAPVGGWIAVTGEWSWPAVVLGAAVGAWIGGFDLIYACQDVEYDRAAGVGSFPARFGVAGALYTSRVVHAVTVALFAWYGVLVAAGLLWFTGVALTAAALGYEHWLVRPGDLSRVNRAFFTVNGVIGIGLFGFALGDLVVRGLGS